ncbi:hypothetical protein IEQ34_019727 [Dendrobium chrysotoxum]|uniref:Acyl-[acyl-carrier-protein] hydrolase n=1 Tax=Dendrobium chrysotoxum TaxID=161865 RepID=A0AAV7G9T0_DENCH|nr:hypothetical protein IEQ34_019727 [Dendrobium chrysotoxum]
MGGSFARRSGVLCPLQVEAKGVRRFSACFRRKRKEFEGSLPASGGSERRSGSLPHCVVKRRFLYRLLRLAVGAKGETHLFSAIPGGEAPGSGRDGLISDKFIGVDRSEARAMDDLHEIRCDSCGGLTRRRDERLYSRCEICTIMTASTAFSTIFSILSSSQPISSSWTGSFNVSFAFTSGVKAKFSCSAKAFQIKGYVKKANTATFSVKSESAGVEEDAPSESKKDVLNFLCWNWLLATLMNIKVAIEKQRNILDWKPWRPDLFADSFSHEQIIDNIYMQRNSIKLYEIDATGKASLETIMNLLQETSVNHFKFLGFLDDSVRSYPKIGRGNLTFVILKMHVHVEHYPSWGDALEVNTWLRNHKKVSMARDWHLRNLKTGQSMIRATSISALMDKTTRKLSKIPDEIKVKLESHYKDTTFILNEDSRKFPKPNVETADYIIDGLTPQWADLDFNMHVNNVKYIRWIFEGIPMSIMETHEMSSMVLEFRKECRMGDVLQSLTTVSSVSSNSSSEFNIVCRHLLQLKSGPALVQGLTTWIQKV